MPDYRINDTAWVVDTFTKDSIRVSGPLTYQGCIYTIEGFAVKTKLIFSGPFGNITVDAKYVFPTEGLAFNAAMGAQREALKEQEQEQEEAKNV